MFLLIKVMDHLKSLKMVSLSPKLSTSLINLSILEPALSKALPIKPTIKLETEPPQPPSLQEPSSNKDLRR